MSEYDKMMAQTNVPFHDINPDVVAGTLVTGYHKGYWKVVRLYIQGKNTVHQCDIVEYVKVLHENGQPVKRKIVRHCNVGYCNVVDPDAIYTAELEAARQKYHNMMDVINEQS